MEVMRTSRSRVCCAGAVLTAALAGVSAIHGQAVYAQGAAPGGVSDKPISLNFQNAPVTTVLKTLFTSVGANYSIDPDVQGSVNIALNSVPFSAALHSLLRSANPPLTYDLVDGVYHIKVKKTTTLATNADTGGTGSTGTTDTGNTVATTDSDRRWFKLPIDHSDVQLILPYIGISKGIFVIPADVNQGRGGSGGMGGGMNGGMGGMNGGMGGMNGGMGGMSGGMGGMSTGMGGMSTGMGGGMGGYGMR